jgi:hypothetical protein
LVISLGSDAALRSRGNWCFFEDVGVEGFLAFQDSVDQVEELGHDGSDDDYGGLAFVLEAFGEALQMGLKRMADMAGKTVLCGCGGCPSCSSGCAFCRWCRSGRCAA